MDFCVFVFFNDTATTEIYTLSLHDALPISSSEEAEMKQGDEIPELKVTPDKYLPHRYAGASGDFNPIHIDPEFAKQVRSEEHTSELQSRQYLVCRLLLEKKKNKYTNTCQSI